MKKFKIGIDVHGVIDAMPEFFSFLTDSIIRNGGEVHIITGGSWSEVEEELNSLNIKWTHSFSVYDHMIKNYDSIGGTITFSDGSIQKRFKNEDWDNIKGLYCKENDIQLHIDDKIAYGVNFETPFAILNKNKI